MNAPNDALLVRRSWLERVDAALFADKPTQEAARATSNFYTIRPAVLKSAWTQNAAGVWNATAAFIVNDAVDASFIFPVTAPTATSTPGGVVDAARFYVAWRGRWEMIAGSITGGQDERPEIRYAPTVASAEVTESTALATAAALPTWARVNHLTSITTEDGALVFTFEEQQHLIAIELETTSAPVVESVTTTTSNVVGDLIWQS